MRREGESEGRGEGRKGEGEGEREGRGRGRGGEGEREGEGRGRGRGRGQSERRGGELLFWCGHWSVWCPAVTHIVALKSLLMVFSEAWWSSRL